MSMHVAQAMTHMPAVQPVRYANGGVGSSESSTGYHNTSEHPSNSLGSRHYSEPSGSPAGRAARAARAADSRLLNLAVAAEQGAAAVRPLLSVCGSLGSRLAHVLQHFYITVFPTHSPPYCFWHPCLDSMLHTKVSSGKDGPEISTYLGFLLSWHPRSCMRGLWEASPHSWVFETPMDEPFTSSS